MPFLKKPPAAGYYAVIFSSEKKDDLEGYAEMDEQTMKEAQLQKGYLGYESVNNGASGIFISYWETRDAIEEWSKYAVHKLAKSGAHKWYKRYLSQVCKVESSSEQEFNF